MSEGGFELVFGDSRLLGSGFQIRARLGAGWLSGLGIDRNAKGLLELGLSDVELRCRCL